MKSYCSIQGRDEIDFYADEGRPLLTGRLILASSSPRRREILAAAGISYLIKAADVDERRLDNEPPSDYVRRLARAKAEAVKGPQDWVVLGADTVVVLGDAVFSKPSDPADAVQMLRQLSGETHRVLTGICLRSRLRTVTDIAETAVSFARLSEAEIREYVASGEPLDKAGAYAIQGLASKYVERIEGCYFNVVGLPISLVWRRLQEFEPPAAASL
jgi:septum formation protein